MKRLQGKRALITGGASGIGAATARLFCLEGAAVALVDMNPASLDRTVQAIKDQVPDALIMPYEANVADAKAADECVRKCTEKFGGLDILVNNAAMRNYSSMINAQPDEWRAMVDVNLIGVANYCRSALPELRRARKGAIINVSSSHAIIGRKGMGIYDTTKAGQLAMTRTLAFEEAEYGVRVNAVCPGSTLTEFHVGRAVEAGKSLDRLKTERSNNSLIGRWANPEELAFPILWLASDEASFITGATLTVDGGLSIM